MVTSNISTITVSEELLFDGTFNNGTVNEIVSAGGCPVETFANSFWKSCVQPPSIVQLTPMIINNEKVAAFITDPANPNRYGIDRSELVINRKNNIEIGVNGTDRYYSFSMYIPSDYTPPESWELFWQIKGINIVARNPSIALNTQPDDRLLITSCSGDFTGNNTSCPTGLKNYYFSPTLKTSELKNKWSHWIIRILWSWEGNGIIQVNYKFEGQANYIQVLNVQNIATGYHEPGYPDSMELLLIGPYRAYQLTRQIIYMTGTKIGKTFQSVEYI